MTMNSPPPAARSPYGAAQSPPRTNTLAVVSFVLVFFVQIAAIVCGHIALVQIKRTGEGGRGFAIAALVLGYLSILIGIIVLIVFLAVLIPSGYMNFDNMPDIRNY